MEVRFLPEPVTTKSKLWFFYELHVGQSIDEEGRLDRVEVLNGDTGSRLLIYEGADLASRTVDMTDEHVPSLGEHRESKSSTHRNTAILIALRLEPRNVPHAFMHRVTLLSAKGQKIVKEGARALVPSEPPTVVGPPLRGRNWVAVNTPHNAGGHRKFFLSVDGREVVAQRFAIDFMRLGWSMKPLRGNPHDNTSYFAYGADVLATADGIVSSLYDGIPENVPNTDSRAIEITFENAAGNYVIVDSGDGKYSFYGHLKPGSLRVEPGANVRRGDVLGLLGNSGNSTEPHLHFHIGNTNSPLGAEGLPYVFDSFSTAFGLRKRRLELPHERSVVNFR